jgi:hypothetical protein
MANNETAGNPTGSNSVVDERSVLKQIRWALITGRGSIINFIPLTMNACSMNGIGLDISLKGQDVIFGFTKPKVKAEMKFPHSMIENQMVTDSQLMYAVIQLNNQLKDIIHEHFYPSQLTGESG